MKLYLKIDYVNDAGRLQVALDLLSDWANERQLSVSVSKRCVLNIGTACNTVVNITWSMLHVMLTTVLQAVHDQMLIFVVTLE